MDDYRYQIGRFGTDIGQEIYENNVDKFTKIINSEQYDKLTLDDKETQAFIAVYISYNKEILRHLVFNYKIKEKNSIEHFKDMNAATIKMLEVNGFKEEITHMFTIRRLNDDLASQLDTKLDKPTNKLKI